MKWFSRKIEELRDQNDRQKARTVSVLTAVSGILLMIMWGAVLLPWQLAWNRPAKPGQVSGARNPSSAITVAPSPSSSPSPSFTGTFKPLP